ncbi:uncharacterized protein TNCV_824281 [Trichonephila clavipes]|nr:uncharacterized protein TNCV_824281 [Trichonephila clavipes]
MLELSSNCVSCVFNWRQISDLAGQENDSKYRSRVSRPQKIWLQEFLWPPCDQHKTITGTKVEPTFIRKRHRSYFRPQMSSGLTPLTSQTAMAWSQRNTRYRMPGSEHDFAVSKAIDHDVVGDETENNSANPQTLVVGNHYINPHREPELMANAGYDTPK